MVSPVGLDPALRRGCLLLVIVSMTGCSSTPEVQDVPAGPSKPYQIHYRFYLNDPSMKKQSYSTGTLRGVLADDYIDFDRYGFRRSDVDDAAYELQEFYRREGFPEAIVEYDYAADTREGRARFRIQEGPRVTISEIRFHGNEAFSNDQLMRFFTGPRRGLLEIGALYFVESQIEGALNAIRSFYYDQGFLEVRIELEDILSGEDETERKLIVGIEEGRRFRLRHYELPDNDLKIELKEIDAALADIVGSPYSPSLPFQIKTRLEEFYRRRGYADATVSVTPSVDRDEGSVSVDLTIDPGIKVTVREIRIEGNDRTAEGFVRSRLEFEPGRLYDSRDERQSFRRLFDTGLFARVNLTLEGEGPERDLIVSLEEAPSLEVFVEPGFGSYELLRTRAGFRERNLFGRGIGFRVAGLVSFRSEELVVGLTEPRLLGTDLSVDLPVFYKRREEPSFTSQDVGFNVFVTENWTRAFQTTIGYGLRTTRVLELKADSPETELDDLFDLASLSFRAKLDERDDVFSPATGFLSSGLVEWGDGSLGSELDFWRVTYGHGHYLQLVEGTTLAAGVRTGFITPTNQTEEIPISERFFNGGESTVRAFRESELGPQDARGEPLGGEVYNVLNLELRQLLIEQLSVAVFADYGNVALRYNDYFDGFRLGLGVGLRYLLPIGPIRLDMGINPHKRKNEDAIVWHIAVGMPF
ncbi:MAG: outer membrane protein assembly factor BamA [Planctomycetota bacterium]